MFQRCYIYKCFEFVLNINFFFTHCHSNISKQVVTKRYLVKEICYRATSSVFFFIIHSAFTHQIWETIRYLLFFKFWFARRRLLCGFVLLVPQSINRLWNWPFKVMEPQNPLAKVSQNLHVKKARDITTSLNHKK